MKPKRTKLWIATILIVSVAILAVRGCYQLLGRARQGIQDGPNTLLCLLNYDDGLTPKTARAKFLRVNTFSIVPFQAKPTSQEREARADTRGKVSLLWSDNSGVWLNEIEADGGTFTRDPTARGDRVPFWQGYTLGLRTDGRSTTAIAVHHLARIKLNRTTSSFTVEHVSDVEIP
jgi:hypothetical protein